MGRRSLTILGRVGMVLLVSGLALGLVSLIPSYSYSPSNVPYSIAPQQYTLLYYPSGIYTPQMGLSISAGSNDSMYLYLLGIRVDQFQNWTITWVTENYPGLEPFKIYTGASNLTVFDSVLQLHPGLILWNSSLVKNVSYEFYPQSVQNVTAVLANPSDHFINVNITSKVLTSFAPRDRVTVASVILIPVGLVFAAPWAITARSRKRAPAQ